MFGDLTPGKMIVVVGILLLIFLGGRGKGNGARKGGTGNSSSSVSRSTPPSTPPMA